MTIMTPDPTAVEQAFLNDIVGNPNDPSLWLILADWLTERDDPRAELLRLTWSLQFEPDHDDFLDRQARVQAMLFAGLKPVRPRLVLGDFEFAWVPPGTFLMGTPAGEVGERPDEKQHRVTLTAPFWMGAYPVTQAQWRSIMGRNPSSYARKDRNIPAAERRRFPVENISWLMVGEFLRKAGKRLGREVTLSSEARWEYACRAGTTTPFHFGSILDGTQANARGSVPYGTDKKGPAVGRPTPVGSYVPNAWGLYDMHGNVWEMCLDVYREDYEKLPAVDPLCEDAETDRRVLRGGASRAVPYRCRSATRYSRPATERSEITGLRICCAAG
jgi:uncharacterized protein (TIGR02996 family)